MRTEESLFVLFEPSTFVTRVARSGLSRGVVHSTAVMDLPPDHLNVARLRVEELDSCEGFHYSASASLVMFPGKSLAASVTCTEGNDDLLHEILKHVDAKTLALASCVNRRWRKAAGNQSLWESICTRFWPATFSRPKQLQSVVAALGGFRRLYALCLHPLLLRSDFSPQNFAFPSLSTCRKGAGGPKWGSDEVHLSLSLFSIDCFERLGRRNYVPSSLPLLNKSTFSLQMLEKLSGVETFYTERGKSVER